MGNLIRSSFGQKYALEPVVLGRVLSIFHAGTTRLGNKRMYKLSGWLMGRGYERCGGWVYCKGKYGRLRRESKWSF